MSSGERMTLEVAEYRAGLLVIALAQSCEEIKIAGSIRRARPDVGDIEIVARPKVEAVEVGLFGETESVEVLTRLTDRMLADGAFTHRLSSDGKRAYGSKYKRLSWGGVAVDLFSSKPDGSNFGLIFMIRTGPGEFSNALVTPQGTRTHDGRAGMLPRHLLVQGGELRYRTSNEILPTPDEAAVWRWLGLEPIAPEDRR